MDSLRALQAAQEELHAASLCLGAARRTNYTTFVGCRHVEVARKRLERAADRYYTILMEVRQSGIPAALGVQHNPNTEPNSEWARKRSQK